METILDALKAMKKATYREIAARLDIEPVMALSMLHEQKELGVCSFHDGGWTLSAEVISEPRAQKSVIHQTPRLHGEIPAAVEPETVCHLLRSNGTMSTAALATAVNRNARGMVAVMLSLSRQGVVIKNGEGKGVTWSLPAIKAPAAEPAPEKSTAEIIEAIPAFASRPDDLIIPSARFISAEIRRTKSKLANLRKLQAAVRELRRHKNLLVGQQHD
ncbi:DUF1627 domain-containing protein [Lelliottia sp. V89_10]|uniref:DUF1627 domain-containing protein n=1 Tax=Lelliottia wanjuensis TaxID=3050585 RepID=UPI00249F9142|nr:MULTISPECIES: DUF1627 domain-containing protein [unclassified Lelliottia]MDI3359746.1 DUF1627 domain-containing protein [Lelliottia sp. V89_13]MDK9548704.1 DUF1627 domain-containing protein [Lelliottia sp. V89_5]MDK9597336.1 DUF1627 domain-containing protein [Lelliottia sp. V89_10]